MSTTRFRSLALLVFGSLVGALPLAGCKQSVGDRCEIASDCASGFCAGDSSNIHMTSATEVRTCTAGPVTGSVGDASTTVDSSTSDGGDAAEVAATDAAAAETGDAASEAHGDTAADGPAGADAASEAGSDAAAEASASDGAADLASDVAIESAGGG